ncbi:MAG: O-antigen/teichoic acid export membrane protein [Desulforhopalus sp.]
MSETTKQFKKQLPKNAVMSILSFVTYSLSALWLTPYLFRHLGAAAYGLVPLAGLFTQYVAIITTQLSGAINRFLSLEINKPGGQPNVVFNSALALYLILIVVQLPLFTVGLFYVDRIFSIPQELMVDALLLLGCSAGGFLLSMLGGVFGVAQFAGNRIDISSSINLGRLIARLVLIIGCFSFLGPQLRYIGFIDLGLQAAMVLVSVGVSRRLFPELSVNLRLIDWRLLGPVFHMSFWTLFNNLGSLLYLRTDIWIINRFISPVAAGQYAAVLVVSNFIRQLAGQGNSQLAPVIMQYWARNELEALQRLLRFSMKLFALGLAIPISLLCIHGNWVLKLWLGDTFEGFAPLLTVMVVHLIFNVAVLPLFSLQTASNSVRWPAVITFIMGTLNVVISYLLGVQFGMGMMGVALSSAVVLTLKNAVFTPLYGAAVLGCSKMEFVRPLLAGVLLTGLLYVLFYVPQWLGWSAPVPADWMRVLCQSTVLVLFSIAVSWFLLLLPDERSAARNMVKLLIRRFLPNA